jgi:hypothetical protein
MVGFALPAAAQKGGKGAGDPESTTFGIQHNTPNAGAKYQNYVFGVVKELNKEGVVLTKTVSGEDRTFKFNKKTKFLLDGKDSTIESVHVGDKIWVDMDEDKKTGDLLAHKVVAGVFLMQ